VEGIISKSGLSSIFEDFSLGRLFRHVKPYKQDFFLIDCLYKPNYIGYENKTDFGRNGYAVQNIHVRKCVRQWRFTPMLSLRNLCAHGPRFSGLGGESLTVHLCFSPFATKAWLVAAARSFAPPFPCCVAFQ